ncbi:hypothetical protein [Paraburkholderia aromaticivorans]|uniref:hypothetical protein n=1 Tax=Paraburkholderia aromaticivorans TaxID=2026199 RepID=UPI0038B8835C
MSIKADIEKQLIQTFTQITNLQARLTHLDSKRANSFTAYECDISEKNDKNVWDEVARLYNSLRDEFKPRVAPTIAQIRETFSFNMECYARNPDRLANQVDTLQKQVRHLFLQMDRLQREVYTLRTRR